MIKIKPYLPEPSNSSVTRVKIPPRIVQAAKEERCGSVIAHILAKELKIFSEKRISCDVSRDGKWFQLGELEWLRYYNNMNLPEDYLEVRVTTNKYSLSIHDFDNEEFVRGEFRDIFAHGGALFVITSWNVFGLKFSGDKIEPVKLGEDARYVLDSTTSPPTLVSLVYPNPDGDGGMVSRYSINAHPLEINLEESGLFFGEPRGRDILVGGDGLVWVVSDGHLRVFDPALKLRCSQAAPDIGNVSSSPSGKIIGSGRTSWREISFSSD